MNDIVASKESRRTLLLPSIVINLALLLRILHVFFAEKFNPLANDLILDAKIYDQWAKAIAFGGPPVPTALMQAPLYPWFLAGVYRLIGPNLLAVRLVQAILGTLAVWCIMYATGRFFRSRATGFVAGLLGAVYLPFIFYEGTIMPAALVVFLNSLFLALVSPGDAGAETSASDGRAPGARSPGAVRLCAAGLVLGLSVMANPVSLLIAPFAILHLFIGEGVPIRPARSLRLALLFVVGLVVALLPLAARNAKLAGELMPLTSGGGINFYIGNNPAATGYYSVPFYGGRLIGSTPEQQLELMNEIAQQAARRKLKPSEVSDFWLRAGLDYIRANPRATAAMAWGKTIYFWNKHERANVENLNFSRRFTGILKLPLLTFGVVMPLGLLGIFLARALSRRLWPLYGGIIATFASAIVFYVLARYRIPMLPFLIPFAAAALVSLVGIVRSRRYFEIALTAAALACLAYFSNMTVARDSSLGVSNNLVRLGNAYVARGDTLAAIDAFSEAFELNPENTSLRHALMQLRANKRR